MSPHPNAYVPKSRLAKWLESRLPIFGLIHSSFVVFPVPRNLNYWWTFGAVLFVMLMIQVITGIFLAMFYVPDVEKAFATYLHIRRDVFFGEQISDVHANGASFFFIAVYIHILRGMYYGSYKAPREILWLLGVIIYFLMMGSAFLGYSLVWGNMSIWAAEVITNFVNTIPVIGSTVLEYARGGYAVDQPTLNRFYALHFVLPFMIIGLAILHVWALHVVGNNNPTGLEIKHPKESLPFHPYMTTKDIASVSLFLLIAAWFIFYMPNYLGHADNFNPADSNSTPAHVVPEWYFLPFYAILRAVPNTLLGLIAMFGAILVMAFLPWLDTSPVRSGKYRPIFKIFFWLWVLNVLFLGWLGTKPTTGADVHLWISGNAVFSEWYKPVSQLSTIFYFLYFFLILPVLGFVEKTKPLPNSILDDVLSKEQRRNAAPVLS